MWDALWTFLLSPLGASIVATLLAFALGKLLLAKPQWAPWKGIIIEGIKYAERAIPDNSALVSLRRLDEAMKYFIRVYEQQVGLPPPKSLIDAARMIIPEIHAELEKNGNLDKTSITLPGVLGLLGLLVLCAGAGGCSPGIQKWSDYGIDNNRVLAANVQKLADQARLGVELEFKENVRLAMTDYRKWASGTLVDMAGKPVPVMTPAMLDQKEKNLLLLVQGRDQKLQETAEDAAVLLKQVQREKEAFVMISRINAAWWRLGNDPQVQLLMERVATALEKLPGAK